MDFEFQNKAENFATGNKGQFLTSVLAGIADGFTKGMAIRREREKENSRNNVEMKKIELDAIKTKNQYERNQDLMALQNKTLDLKDYQARENSRIQDEKLAIESLKNFNMNALGNKKADIEQQKSLMDAEYKKGMLNVQQSRAAAYSKVSDALAEKYKRTGTVSFNNDKEYRQGLKDLETFRQHKQVIQQDLADAQIQLQRAQESGNARMEMDAKQRIQVSQDNLTTIDSTMQSLQKAISRKQPTVVQKTNAPVGTYSKFATAKSREELKAMAKSIMPKSNASDAEINDFNEAYTKRFNELK